jgi:hypothetical protein
MKQNLNRLNVFHSRGDGVRVFVDENRNEKNQRRQQTENKTRQSIFDQSVNAARRNPGHQRQHQKPAIINPHWNARNVRDEKLFFQKLETLHYSN